MKKSTKGVIVLGISIAVYYVIMTWLLSNPFLI